MKRTIKVALSAFKPEDLNGDYYTVLCASSDNFFDPNLVTLCSEIRLLNGAYQNWFVVAQGSKIVDASQQLSSAVRMFNEIAGKAKEGE